jgi:hypothetical protein
MRSKNRALKFIQLALFPVSLMVYGFYLGQLHQSMQDLAGILMFIVGVLALAVSLVIHWISHKASWYDKWYANMITGALSCAIVFAMIAIYARMHG